MTDLTTLLPHEQLYAYRVARDLVVAVREARISDSGLRDQALRAATSVCLNIAEATGRPGAADQRRVYGIARGRRAKLPLLSTLPLLPGSVLPTPGFAGGRWRGGLMRC